MDNIFSLPIILISISLLALISFFLSASETSIIGLSKIRLHHMVAQKVRRAKNIQQLVLKMDKFIATILVLNNFSNIAISAVVTAICVVMLDNYKWGVVLATFASAFFIVIICDITPKLLAIKHTERTALFVAPIMETVIRIFSPLTAIFTKASNFIIKLLKIDPGKKSPLITEEELRLLIELAKKEGFLSDDEGKMLQRIFEFGDTRVGDVLVPKDEIVAANINTTPEELLNTFVEKGHARLPVYQDSIENIIGIIYAHDLLYILRDKGLFVLQDLVHEAYYVSAKTRVNDVLKKFQNDKIQMAIVIDENKKTLGLVTLENLIEEIVGEIEERYPKRISRKKQLPNIKVM